ncbi:hypothetical protein FPV67DRAFT_1664211 [Lyophyllum atratum]|nr:hypothetical protein FPV67DRAFT_1664211 [Lyophyllum atratum]
MSYDDYNIDHSPDGFYTTVGFVGGILLLLGVMVFAVRSGEKGKQRKPRVIPSSTAPPTRTIPEKQYETWGSDSTVNVAYPPKATFLSLDDAQALLFHRILTSQLD